MRTRPAGGLGAYTPGGFLIYAYQPAHGGMRIFLKKGAIVTVIRCDKTNFTAYSGVESALLVQGLIYRNFLTPSFYLQVAISNILFTTNDNPSLFYLFQSISYIFFILSIFSIFDLLILSIPHIIIYIVEVLYQSSIYQLPGKIDSWLNLVQVSIYSLPLEFSFTLSIQNYLRQFLDFSFLDYLQFLSSIISGSIIKYYITLILI